MDAVAQSLDVPSETFEVKEKDLVFSVSGISGVGKEPNPCVKYPYHKN